MNKGKVYLTKTGLEALKTEYKMLTEDKRLEMALRIKRAREMGDISENAEYEAAREEQAIFEGRITELEEIFKNAETIKDSGQNGHVTVGSVVKVHVEGSDEEFHIVGAPEANPMNRKISHESPLGLALLGKKIGDKVQVEAPVGNLIYTIISIK